MRRIVDGAMACPVVACKSPQSATQLHRIITTACTEYSIQVVENEGTGEGRGTSTLYAHCTKVPVSYCTWVPRTRCDAVVVDLAPFLP